MADFPQSLAGARPLVRNLGRVWFRSGFADSADDAAQEIAAAVLERAGRYEPTRFRSGFLVRGCACRSDPAPAAAPGLATGARVTAGRSKTPSRL